MLHNKLKVTFNKIFSAKGRTSVEEAYYMIKTYACYLISEVTDVCFSFHYILHCFFN